MSIYRCFAATVGGGNKAGVVLSREPIVSAVAQAIARRLGAPTSVFVARSEIASTSVVRARFFTPTTEIGGCGHATVALVHALGEETASERNTFLVESTGGSASATLLQSDDVELAVPARIDRLDASIAADVPAALGLAPNTVRTPVVASTTIRHLVVPVHRVNLADIRAERSSLVRLARLANVDTIAVMTPARSGRVHVRDFCAAIGDLEEPASGTTAAAVARYVEATTGETSVVIDQGVEMGSPSVLHATVTPVEARVRGAVRRVFLGSLHPDADKADWSISADSDKGELGCV